MNGDSNIKRVKWGKCQEKNITIGEHKSSVPPVTGLLRIMARRRDIIQAPCAGRGSGKDRLAYGGGASSGDSALRLQA